MTFPAKHAAKHLGRQRGGRALQDDWLPVCPEVWRGQLLLVVSLTVGKAPISVKGEVKLSLEPTGFQLFQLKRTHVPKWHVLGGPY